MGYKQARDKIVSLVEGVSVVDSSITELRAKRAPVPGGAFGAAFKHFPEGADERLPKSRGFYLQALSHAMKGPYTPGLPQRHNSQMLLTVVYRESQDFATVDETMAFDHRQISTTLLAASNWARSTSTIISIHAADDLLMPATIDSVEGAKLLRITFSMEYTS